MEEMYEASYEIEVRYPLLDSNGNLNDLDLAENLINEVGICHATEAGFGDRCAIGDVDFASFKDAYEWKLKTQALLDEKFPSTDAKAFCGLNVYGLEDDLEEKTYLEIVELDDTLVASNEVDAPLAPDQAPINLTEDKFDIQEMEESEPVSLEAKKIEAVVIKNNAASLGDRRHEA